MKVLSSVLITVVATLIPSASAALRGFNFAANNPDGSCKSYDQWRDAFSRMQVSPGEFNSARLYSTNDCNTLANAIPAALNTNTKILVGVWTQDDNKFNNEKQALLNAIRQYGSNWMLAVSVGSEDLYRRETSPESIAAKIYDVRGMIRAEGVNVPVGHVDTWSVWVDGANDVVTRACDFVGLDGYPYFEGASIAKAGQVFMSSLKRTRAHVARVKRGTPIWVTETGWPVSGETVGQAVPSVQNARKYWRQLVCTKRLPNVHLFWYAERDYWMTPSFGMTGNDGKRIFNVGKC